MLTGAGNVTKQTDEVMAKDQLVARGDDDPDLYGPRQDAFHMTRTSFYVVPCVIAAYHMEMFCGDIAGAFRQGLKELAQRELPLF